MFAAKKFYTSSFTSRGAIHPLLVGFARLACKLLLVAAVVVKILWLTLGWAAWLWAAWARLTATWLWWTAWITAVIAIAAAAC